MSPDTELTTEQLMAIAGPPSGGPAQAPARQSAAPVGVRNQNQGNLKDGPFARRQPGYTGRNGVFATFDTPEAGDRAQENLLSANYLGQGFRTPSAIVNKYAPVGPENSQESVNNYIGHISRRLGINPDQPVPPDQVATLAQAMREFENGTWQSAAGDAPAAAPVLPDVPAIHRPENLNTEALIALAGQPGDSQENPFVVKPDTPREVLTNLPKGTWIATEDDGDGKYYVHRMAGDAYRNLDGPQGDVQLQGGNAYLHEVDGMDALRAFSTAAAEQVPGLDEAAVGITAAFDPTRDFSQVRDNYRAMQAVDNQTNRGARDLGGVAGAVGTMAVPVGAGAGLLGRGGSLAMRAGKASALAVPVAGVTGFLNADGGLQERATAGGVSALLGGAVAPLAVVGGEAAGALAPRLVAGAQEAGNRVRGLLGREVPEAAITPQSTGSATDYVRGLLNRSGASLDNNPVAAMGKPITAAEAIGPTGVAQVAGLTRRTGRTGVAATDQLATRAREAQRRIVDDFAGVSGLNPDNAFDTVAAISAQGRAKAGPLYDQAYAMRLEPSDEINSIIATPSGRQAMNRAVKIAGDDRRNPADLGFEVRASGVDANGMPILEEVRLSNPSVETLDYIKRGLDSVLNDSRNPITNRLKLDESTRPIVNLARNLREEVIRLTGGETGPYAQALQTSGDAIRLDSAFGDASKLLSQNVRIRQFNDRVGQMGEAERQALSAGIADHMLGEMQRGRLRPSQLDNEQFREKISALVGADKAQEFVSRLRSEIDLARTGARMAPGSNSVTAEAMQAMREQDGGDTIGGLLANNMRGGDVKRGLLSTVGEVVGAPIGGFVRGMQSPQPAAVRDEIGRLLLLSPDELNRALSASQGGLLKPKTSGATGVVSGLLASQLAG